MPSFGRRNPSGPNAGPPPDGVAAGPLPPSEDLRVDAFRKQQVKQWFAEAEAENEADRREFEEWKRNRRRASLEAGGGLPGDGDGGDGDGGGD